MAIKKYQYQGLSATGLLIAALLGAAHIMFFLGWSLVHYYRELQLKDAANAGALYVEGFLAPHAHEFFATQTLSAQSKAKLEQLLDRLPVSGHFEVLKIWDNTGKFIFSTDNTTNDEDEQPDDIARALRGEVMVEIFTEKTEHPDSPLQPPYLEIYAPIFDSTNSNIIAIGEIYQDATEFLHQRAVVERSIWGLLGVFSVIGLSGLSFLMASQRKTLMRHLSEVSSIARQNQQLKQDADRTRIDATESNEHLLNQIGAELHDGPIQMLTLMMLMEGKDKADRVTAQGVTSGEIGKRVIDELRSISAGLSLPELHGLSLEEVLLLATSRHETFIGQKVETTFIGLPLTIDHGLKICCYRFVQEGLNNAYKHGGGSGERVSCNVSDNVMTLAVSNNGTGTASEVAKAGNFGGGIGLLGLRHRLDVFGGKLEFKCLPSGASELIAKIKLTQAQSESVP